VGEVCRLNIVDHVREDTHLLFGFATDDEQHMFGLLTGINGIGPKLALSALSGLTVRDLTAAVLDGDVKRLSTIQGIGRKMAERMVVELRDRIDPGEAMRARAAKQGGDMSGQALADAVLALSALGYSQDQARKMVEKVLALSDPPTGVEAIIKRALSGR
jgi:Holliday junction DNA helicase RuvA